MKIPPHSSRSGRATTRRRFLQTTGGAVAGVSALGFPAIVSSKSPISKLNIAIIGSGGRGGRNLREVEESGELPSVDEELPSVDEELPSLDEETPPAEGSE